MKNPVLEEAAGVYLRQREYAILHIVFAAASAFFLVTLWPSRSVVYFFRTGTIPSAFQAVAITQALAVTGLSLYAGLDRLAESRIIRHSEWLERTAIPIRTLATGKIVSGTLHTIFLTLLGLPIATIAAGPSGIVLEEVFATQLIVLLSGLVGRFAGMLLAHLGETRNAVRAIGVWIVVALLFVATIEIGPPANPVIGVLMQHSDVNPSGVSRPLLASSFSLAATALGLAVLYLLSLWRHRQLARRRGKDAFIG